MQKKTEMKHKHVANEWCMIFVMKKCIIYLMLPSLIHIRQIPEAICYLFGTICTYSFKANFWSHVLFIWYYLHLFIQGKFLKPCVIYLVLPALIHSRQISEAMCYLFGTTCTYTSKVAITIPGSRDSANPKISRLVRPNPRIFGIVFFNY